MRDSSAVWLTEELGRDAFFPDDSQKANGQKKRRRRKEKDVTDELAHVIDLGTLYSSILDKMASLWEH